MQRAEAPLRDLFVCEAVGAEGLVCLVWGGDFARINESSYWQWRVTRRFSLNAYGFTMVIAALRAFGLVLVEEPLARDIVYVRSSVGVVAHVVVAAALHMGTDLPSSPPPSYEGDGA